MRLICPNCGAKYEVDAAVIPEQGRDVQCSNCGHTWFQQPEHKDLETAEELADEAAIAQALSNADPLPDTAPDEEPDVEGEEHSIAVPERELDPEIAKLLREEAEHEVEARKAEADGLETQPELGLDTSGQTADRAAAAQARMARLRGGEEAGNEAEAALSGGNAAIGSRSELLPDVDEINSSLRPSDERPEPEPEPILETEPIEAAERPRRRRGGAGRWVFRLIVLMVIVALAVYFLAPQIVEFAPQAEPYLAQYVDAINGLRDQVNPLIIGLIEQVQGLITGDEAAPE